MSSYATRKASAIESSGLSTSSNNTSAKYAAAHRPSATSQTNRTRLESAGIPACADGVPCSASLVQDSNLVINKDPPCLKIVVRGGDGDLRRGEVEGMRGDPPVTHCRPGRANPSLRKRTLKCSMALAMVQVSNCRMASKVERSSGRSEERRVGKE